MEHYGAKLRPSNASAATRMFYQKVVPSKYFLLYFSTKDRFQQAFPKKCQQTNKRPLDFYFCASPEGRTGVSTVAIQGKGAI